MAGGEKAAKVTNVEMLSWSFRAFRGKITWLLLIRNLISKRFYWYFNSFIGILSKMPVMNNNSSLIDLIDRRFSRLSRTLCKDRIQTKEYSKNIRWVTNDEQNVKLCYLSTQTHTSAVSCVIRISSAHTPLLTNSDDRGRLSELVLTSAPLLINTTRSKVRRWDPNCWSRTNSCPAFTWAQHFPDAPAHVFWRTLTSIRKAPVRTPRSRGHLDLCLIVRVGCGPPHRQQRL